MTSIICTSGFHLELARAMSSAYFDDKLEIVYVPKGKGLRQKLLYALVFIRFYALFILRKKRSAIVPHFFSPWFSLVALASDEISFYDDGIAYYYASNTPCNFRSKIYFWLSSRHNRSNHIRDVGRITFLEYINNSRVKSFYALFPSHLPRMRVPVFDIPFENRSRAKVSSGAIIYLDTAPSAIELIGPEQIMKTLKSLAQTNGERILFKEHPRHKTVISAYLATQEWAEQIVEEYESFLVHTNIKTLICVYSSALLSTYMLSPTTELYSFTSNKMEATMGDLRNIYAAIGVKFIANE